MVSPKYGVGLLSLAGAALAQVTIYGQTPLAQTKTDGSWAAMTTLAAYNDTFLTPPAAPNPPVNNNFAVQLTKDAAQVQGISIAHNGPSFYGFSIEMSVITQILGKNSSYLQVPFLNLMANIKERAGGVYVRLGGNTQEFATMVEEGDSRLSPGHTFGKEISGSTQTTLTPAVLYTRDMFYIANNISSLVGVKWFLGIPFNDSVNWRIGIAEEGQQILGSNLMGLQAANEPDFYVTFGRRVAPYTPTDYKREIGELIDYMGKSSKITNTKMLIGPSVSGQNDNWHAQDVFATGFLDDYADYLVAITVEHYPNNNCIAMYSPAGTPGAIVPQDVLPDYLNHGKVAELASTYAEDANTAVQHNKPFIMFEMNTASCGGFPGISDTFTSTLWALDYGLQMAFQNTTHALMHVGGQNVYYNPFTAPPTNQSAYNEWTIGPIFYSALVIAEALGKSNTAQIVDRNANEGSANTPAYAIYENGVLSKAALFNYIDDDTGSNDLTVSLTVDGGVPSSVSVKYLLAPSVNEKRNITWAGQTFGEKFKVDGRLRGDLNVTSIPCDVTNNICRIPVPSPGFALVFFSSSDEQLTISQASQTFATTAYSKAHNTIKYDPAVLATSNGHNAGLLAQKLGSTSPGAFKNGASAGVVSVAMTAVVLGFGGAVWTVLSS